MSKRLTETDKWNDPWFRRLKAGEKLVFLYLVDCCDNAGFLEIDYDLIEFQTGVRKDRIRGAIQGLNRALIISGNWLFIKNFLVHQKNWPINPENNYHKQIIGLFQSRFRYFKDNEEFKKYLGATKGLGSRLGLGLGLGLEKKGGVGEGKTTNTRRKPQVPTLQEVKDYFKEKRYTEAGAIKAFEYYDLNNWHDSEGRPVLAWKQKVYANWMKDEYKIQPVQLESATTQRTFD